MDLDDVLDIIMQRHMGFSYEKPISYHSYRYPSFTPQHPTPPSRSIGNTLPVACITRPTTSSHYSNMSSGNQTPVSTPRIDMKGGQQPRALSSHYAQYSQDLFPAVCDNEAPVVSESGSRRDMPHATNPPPTVAGYDGPLNSVYNHTYQHSGGSSWYNAPTLDNLYSPTPSTSAGTSRSYLPQQPQHPNFPMNPHERSNPNLTVFPSTSPGNPSCS